MPLTPEQIAQMDAITGLPPTKPNQKAIDSRIAELRALAAPKPEPKLGEGAAGEFGAGVVGSLLKTGSTIEKGLDQTAGRLINAAQGRGFVPTTTGEEARAFAEKVTDKNAATKTGEFIGTAGQYLAGPGGAAKTAEAAGAKILPKVGAFVAKQIPEVAKDVAIGTANTGDLGEGVEQGAAGFAGAGALKLAGKGVSKILRNVNPDEAGQIERAVSALNPSLKGKKGVEGYKEIVTGRRDVVKFPGVMSKQEITATPQVQELGTRLADVIKTEEPLKNLQALGKDMAQTEAKIDVALDGDPTLVFNADKPGLLTKLDEIRSSMPREVAGIRESKKMFNDVLDYAKELVQEGDDTVRGIRDLRKAFDQQARLEYPNAFKGEGIDTKTPAGRAIKAARDVINDHLYETAPEGSLIKELIGREADLYRATDLIAPKAFELDGVTATEKVLREWFKHPVAISLSALAALAGASAAGSAVVNAASGGEGGK